MTLELERPRAAEDLYLARAEEVDAFRPVIQGDVFRNVAIPGVELKHDGVMLVEHPCSMRKGAKLKARLQAIPVIKYQRVSLEHWPTKHLRVFPLPGLDRNTPDTHLAASFDEIGMINSSELSLGSRVACLSESGILILQQRRIFSQARTKVETSTLREHQAHIFEEVELQEDWNRELVSLRVLIGEELELAIAAEAIEFDAYLQSSSEPGANESLRERLLVEHHRASVRRQVRREVSRRADDVRNTAQSGLVEDDKG